jgi:hypothetical protein
MTAGGDGPAEDGMERRPQAVADGQTREASQRRMSS